MTVPQRNFVVDLGWQVLLKDLGISAQDVLRIARLPLDLFSRENPTLTTDEYFRLWVAMSDVFDDPTFPLKLGQSVSVEAFSPPIFACFCSADLNTALARLAQYKPLIGPMRFDVTKDDRQTSVALAGLPDNAPVPPSLIAAELVFLVYMARLATRQRIEPDAVVVEVPLPAVEAYEDFFGCDVDVGSPSRLTFLAQDAHMSFLTASEKMWSVFEPELRKRMAELDQQSPFRDRVRACLIEILASGQCSMADVAQRLAVSNRTLQRRLHEESTSLQQEVNCLRKELARHYLTSSGYSSAEIAFLLGYDDPNSFIRAFHAWTGQTPETARSAARLH
jgi:AraC-like DNA-binding protein